MQELSQNPNLTGGKLCTLFEGAVPLQCHFQLHHTTVWVGFSVYVSVYHFQVKLNSEQGKITQNMIT